MSAIARFQLLLSLAFLLLGLRGSAAPATVVRQEGRLWLLENTCLRVSVDPASGRIAVLDSRCGRQWRQPDGAQRPLRNVRRLPDGIACEADFGSTRGRSNRVTVSLRLPTGAADLSVTADMANRAEPLDAFLFLEPFILETPDGVLAVADYCDGHLYPLGAEPFPRTWFDGGRLDLPFVGVCDLAKGFGYAVILETSDDAFVQCQPSGVAGRRIYAPQVGWLASKGALRYPRRLLYRFASAGGYVALARSYRAYAQAAGLVVPFTQKLKRNANIRRLFGAPDVWGDASLAFARQAKAAGVEKMLIHGRSAPDEMKEIGALGYLPSEYDNYTDILPLEAGKPPDSNHDRLPETAVLNADGKRMTAWLTYDKKTQYMKRCPALWVAAARLVIPALLKTHPFLGRFIDVTTAEGLYECYDPNHPLVKAEKREAGQQLLAYVRANGLVVGGEHGIWWGAPYQDYIEGMMSGNRFAWPAGHLIHPKDRQEKFSGPYGTETWDVYDRWSLGHAWRAPLWELVFHDCMVSTWYWGDANDYLLDAAPETIAKKDAFNVLYGTMPMLWADAQSSWQKDRAAFLRTYRNVCRLHETVAEAELLNHEFLTPDHALQRTRFSNGTVCVVNFGEKALPVTLAGKRYLLPQNGWAVQGPHFAQSRALVGNTVVTRIAEPGYTSQEIDGRVVTARATGPARIRVRFAGPEQAAEMQPGLVQSEWDLATTHAFALDAEGGRVRQLSFSRVGNSLRLTVGGSANVELICGAAAHVPDLQIDAGDMTVSPAGPLRQGAIATARVRVRNSGGAPASRARVALYADAERPGNLLGATTVAIAPGASRTVEFRIDTTAIDGPHHLVADATLAQRELCSRNNSASLALTVLPNFSRWPQQRFVSVAAGEVEREEATAEVRLNAAALNPASVRVAACDASGRPRSLVPCQTHRISPGEWSILFTVPGLLPAGQSRRFVLLSAPVGGTRFLSSGGSSWDGAHLAFHGMTYEAHFANGTLREIGLPGHVAISHLMFSSEATGWTEEPGTVQHFEVLEDGPVRTVVSVRKALLAGVVTEKTFTFYRDRFEVAGSARGGNGVFSRAYYLLPGQYEDSGGYRAQVDGQGDAEGVSNRGRDPRWYTVTGAGWGHSCVALSPAANITYWDASGGWGGIGFNTASLEDVRLCYVFHTGVLPASYGALDMRRLTMPVQVTFEQADNSTERIQMSDCTPRAAHAPELLTLRTRTAVFGIDATGAVSTLSIRGQGNYLAADQPAPLLSVRVDGTLHAPDRAEWDAHSRKLTLYFGKVGVTVSVSAQAKPSHVVFTLVGMEPMGRVELVVWGPYPTKLHDIVGETVGVVRDSEAAVGLQALNPKTIGGYPDLDNDDDPGYGADDPGSYPDLPAELLQGQSWRGNTARTTAYGSLLQAYCRDRSRSRVIANWGHDRYEAPPFHDGGVIGSGIALFACPAAQALPAIGEIEIAEGLPHPMIDGVWGKVSPGATASYLIVDFSEENVDRAIEMTRRAGLKYLYHSSPFATWGHFALKPELFPHGWDGLKACVDKARAAGIRIGFHTLSNFITTNDPYVTPIPDPRLARVGSDVLTADVDATQSELPVVSPDLFVKNTTLNTVMIDRELIRYKSVSAQVPWRLLGCERGAWGTHAAGHTGGATVARLADHDYKVFLGDAALSGDVARNIADLFNHVGALQTSFDGLEGNQSTALGEYGRTLFTKAWYDALSPALQGHVINDASNPGHYNWHINTRMNWGEPWYAGFRESQTLYRFKNQVYFERNFMPHMLGWFALRPDTSIEDAEWLLARAAGFDAGFTIATSLASTAQLAADPTSAETAKHFGATTAILEAVRQWETARMAGAFPAQVKSLLRDNAREFHLQPAGKNRWDLFAAHTVRFACDTAPRDAAEFSFSNVDAEQPLQWTIHSTAGQPLTGLTLEVDGAWVLDLKEASLPAGGNLKYTGGPQAVIYDEAWKELTRVPVDTGHMRIAPGLHQLKIGWQNGVAGSLKVEVRTFEPAIRVGSTTHKQ